MRRDEELNFEDIKYFDIPKIYDDVESLHSDNEDQNVLFVLKKSSSRKEYSVIVEENFDEEKNELIEVLCVLKEFDFHIVNERIEEIKEELLKQEDQEIRFRKNVCTYSHSSHCRDEIFVDYTQFDEDIYCNCEECQLALENINY